ILLPALSHARRQAAGTKCLSNERQLMIAVVMYCNDNQGFLPYTGWGDVPPNRINSNRGGANNFSQWSADWLWDPTQVYNPFGLVPAPATTNITPDAVRTGALWPYL